MDFLSVCRYILQTLLTLINRLSCVSPIQQNWIFILSHGILDQKGMFVYIVLSNKISHHDGEILRYTTNCILLHFVVIQKFTVRLRDLARTRSQNFFIITLLSNRRRKFLFSNTAYRLFSSKKLYDDSQFASKIFSLSQI